MASQRHLSDHGVFGSPGDVSPWDIRFDPGDVAYLERTPVGWVRIRLWAEPRLADATVVVRTGSEVETFSMRPIGTGGTATLWEAVIAKRSGFSYSLAFRTDRGHPVYLCPAGVTNAIERLDRWAVDAYGGIGVAAPEWARGAVVYQVFPDRFAAGDPIQDAPGKLPWGSVPSADGFFGGDLAGVTGRLEYLAELGVDVLYLNPIFTSPSNHRYDTVDYYTVDRRLGGNEAFGALVEGAHARGIRIVLDVSFNHCHPKFFAFADLLERGADSEYADWFVIRQWPVSVGYRPHLLEDPAAVDRLQSETGVDFIAIDGVGPRFEPGYDTWYDVPTMPRLNLANGATRDYMLAVARYWVEEFGIDGWRMDVTRYVEPDFWRDIRTVVRAVNPGAYLLAEVFGDASAWLQGDAFDGTMNYTLRQLALQFFATREIDGTAFLQGLTRLWGMYGEDASLCNHNPLSTHDVARFLTAASGSRSSLYLATSFQLLFPGMPGLYYGDEVGLEGGEDPACRGTFPWDPDPRLHPVYRHVAGLIALRRMFPVLRNGRFEPVLSGGDVVAFARVDTEQRLVVVVNRSTRAKRLDLAATEVLWGAATPGSRLRIAAMSAAVMVPRSPGGSQPAAVAGLSLDRPYSEAERPTWPV